MTPPAALAPRPEAAWSAVLDSVRPPAAVAPRPEAAWSAVLDSVRPPAAPPEAIRSRPVVTAADLAALARQLGRPPRAVVAVAARCRCGAPLVARTAPLLPDGAPFPTTYYLTHPAAARAISRLESAGAMAAFNRALAEDPALAAGHRRAHQDYLSRRGELGEPPALAGVSAGGMPDRVKCLHALAAHALAAGPGVNPVGDLALLAAAPDWRPDRCACRAAMTPGRGPADV